MIQLLDNNGNKVTIYNANYQIRNYDGSITWYDTETTKTWLATISANGIIILTLSAQYNITKAAAPSLDTIISEISSCTTRPGLSTYQLSILKNYLRKFNSKTKQWNSKLKNINL